MRINILLEELIDIANISKTDFALSMNMTPSGLSKILAGKRIPIFKERRQFTRQAATYFAEAIYTTGCYLKLANIFPVLYDFKSVDELRSFFTCAIEYALDHDFLIDNNVNLSYTERGIFFWTEKNVLNILCVTLSDNIIKNTDTSLEFFSTLPLVNPIYARIFQRIRIANPNKMKNLVLNYFFNSTFLDGDHQSSQSLLTFIMFAQRYFDLNFWNMESVVEQPFLLLKGHVLLLFNIQIDGTPLITPIYHKGYLTIFLDSLMKKNIKKISYNKEESIAYLREHPKFLPQLLNSGIDSVYNFITVGYLLQKSEIKSLKTVPGIYEPIFALLNGILTRKTTFTVSVATMERFVDTGRAIVPLLGVVHLTPEERIPYLQRFNAYLNKDRFEKVKIVESELSNIVLLTAQGLGIIYTIDDKLQNEKVHFFDNPHITDLLSNQILSKYKQTLTFSPELWDAYQEQLTDTP